MLTRDDEIQEARFNGMCKIKTICPHCYSDIIIGLTGWKTDAFAVDRKCKYCSRDLRINVVISAKKS